ncbi:MAG: hypothetical protein AAFX99_23350 [Myxococcota bacterium]
MTDHPSSPDTPPPIFTRQQAEMLLQGLSTPQAAAIIEHLPDAYRNLLQRFIDQSQTHGPEMAAESVSMAMAEASRPGQHPSEQSPSDVPPISALGTLTETPLAEQLSAILPFTAQLSALLKRHGDTLADAESAIQALEALAFELDPDFAAASTHAEATEGVQAEATEGAQGESIESAPPPIALEGLTVQGLLNPSETVDSASGRPAASAPNAPKVTDPPDSAAMPSATTRALVADTLRELRTVASEEQELAALLADAHQLTEPVQQIVADMPRILTHADAQRQLNKLGRTVQRLEKALDAKRPTRMLAALLPIVERWTTLAESSQHPSRAGLFVLQAILMEVATLMGDPAQEGMVERAWERAIDAATETGDAHNLRLAVQRQQAAAVDRGDLTTAAALAEQLSTVADDAQVPPLQIQARLEQALALANTAPHQGLAIAQEALELAQGHNDGALLGAARVVLGQLYDHTEEPSAARAAYDDALAEADPTDATTRAGAHQGLAGLAYQEEDFELAQHHLHQARQSALEARHGALFSRASLLLVYTCDALDDRAGAVEALVMARSTLEQSFGPEAAAPFLEVAQVLGERWGEEELALEFEAFRAMLRAKHQGT